MLFPDPGFETAYVKGKIFSATHSLLSTLDITWNHDTYHDTIIDNKLEMEMCYMASYMAAFFFISVKVGELDL